MTKAELIDFVYGKLENVSKKETEALVDSVFETLKVAIREGRFSYPKFGTFTVRERAARKGRNPHTGAEIDIAASKNVGFKVAPALKAEL